MSRVLVNSFKNIRRTPYQAIAVILVLTLTFFVGQVFALLLLGSQEILSFFETKPQVTAFFQDSVDEPTILAIKSDLEAKSYVQEVTYVSKNKALTIYRQQNQDDPLLLEMVTADILPASIEVSATTVASLPDIKNQLESLNGVEEVIYHQDVVDTLRKWTKGLRLSGIIIISYLSITSLLIITIIISMKVSTKRKEIGVMRLLGAKSWYIKGPFIFEGALYGILGAIFSWVITYILILYSTPVLVDFLTEIPLLPVPTTTMLIILATTAIFGGFIGMLSGFFSSRRFAKV